MFDTKSNKSMPMSDLRRKQVEDYEGRPLTMLTSKGKTVN